MKDCTMDLYRRHFDFFLFFPRSKRLHFVHCKRNVKAYFLKKKNKQKTKKKNKKKKQKKKKKKNINNKKQKQNKTQSTSLSSALFAG